MTADAADALARALVEAMGHDEWYALMPADAEVAADRIRRRLRAKGYEVRRIAPSAAADLDVEALAVALDNVDREYERGWAPTQYARAVAAAYAAAREARGPSPRPEIGAGVRHLEGAK